MNELITISGVRGYIDEAGVAQLNLEDVARGLGFTQTASGSGNEVVRWERVASYLIDLKFVIPTCGDAERKDVTFIPENIFYRLAMKAKNETAEKFQAVVADEILPAIRKTGGYMVKPMTVEDMIIAQATSVKELKSQVSELSQTVGKLAEIQSHKAEVVQSLPPVNPLTQRAQLNQIVRGYAERNKVEYRDVWGSLYGEYGSRYSINLKTRAKNRQQSPMDYAQYNGQLSDVLALSIELFC
jgi:prophage antirepressor-like protein